jgi:hypothetical protein
VTLNSRELVRHCPTTVSPDVTEARPDLKRINAYIQADPTLKQRALDRQTPLNPAAKPGRYEPPDDLLAFLERL